MSWCYDLSKWHPVCTGKHLVATGSHLYVYCPVCGVAANVESISAKISPADACQVGLVDRQVIGGQSIGVDKGAYK